MDLLLCLLGMPLLVILFPVVAVAITMSSRGPVLYRVRRVGRGGRLFTIYKFRTMYVGTDGQGPAVTMRGDVRVTPLGRWLRRTKLDELPQLVNIMKGEMSFVGPRPEDVRYVKRYSEAQRAILTVRPGLTSPASLKYRSEEELIDGDDWERIYVEKVLPDKLAIDLTYITRATCRSDLALILATLITCASPSRWSHPLGRFRGCN